MGAGFPYIHRAKRRKRLYTVGLVDLIRWKERRENLRRFGSCIRKPLRDVDTPSSSVRMSLLYLRPLVVIFFSTQHHKHTSQTVLSRVRS